MRRHSWLLAAAVAIAAPSTFAQSPQAQGDGTQQGFFKPGTGPTLGTPPAPAALEATPVAPQAQPAAPLVEALVVQAREREALERELDRTERENARLQADAARPVVPLIVSPLDGSAPIVSPLGR